MSIGFLQARFSVLMAALPPASSGPLVSAPTNHEIAGYMPGRLEFEHEVENEAEGPVKDMEFGLVYKYGGDEQPQAQVTKPKDGEEEEEEDKDDSESKEDGNASEIKAEEVAKVQVKTEPGLDEEETSGGRNRHSASPMTDLKKNKAKQKDKEKDREKVKEKEKEKGGEEAEEAVVEAVVEMEDEGELEVKLAMLDIYFSKLDKREEVKDFIFDRGLTEYKKVSSCDWVGGPSFPPSTRSPS